MSAYLFAIYLVVWTVLFLYLVYLTRQQSQIGRELRSLSDRLKNQQPDGEPEI